MPFDRSTGSRSGRTDLINQRLLKEEGRPRVNAGAGLSWRVLKWNQAAATAEWRLGTLPAFMYGNIARIK